MKGEAEVRRQALEALAAEHKKRLAAARENAAERLKKIELRADEMYAATISISEKLHSDAVLNYRKETERLLKSMNDSFEEESENIEQGVFQADLKEALTMILDEASAAVLMCVEKKEGDGQ